jgi:putative transposase
MDARQAFPTDLTEPQWTRVSHLIPSPRNGGRPAKYARREIVNALLYVRRTGCHWRALPHSLPPWRIVYWYVMAWKRDGTLDRLFDELRDEQ